MLDSMDTEACIQRFQCPTERRVNNPFSLNGTIQNSPSKRNLMTNLSNQQIVPHKLTSLTHRSLHDQHVRPKPSKILKSLQTCDPIDADPDNPRQFEMSEKGDNVNKHARYSQTH